MFIWVCLKTRQFLAFVRRLLRGDELAWVILISLVYTWIVAYLFLEFATLTIAAILAYRKVVVCYMLS